MNTLERQDEILQMMYWMRGEQLGDAVTSAQLNRFLGIEPAAVDGALERLVERGLVSFAEGRYALTERGVSEGGRRFLDEFAGILGKDDHLSCSDPGCDCQAPGFAGTCRSVEVSH